MLKPTIAYRTNEAKKHDAPVMYTSNKNKCFDTLFSMTNENSETVFVILALSVLLRAPQSGVRWNIAKIAPKHQGISPLYTVLAREHNSTKWPPQILPFSTRNMQYLIVKLESNSQLSFKVKLSNFSKTTIVGYEKPENGTLLPIYGYSSYSFDSRLNFLSSEYAPAAFVRIDKPIHQVLDAIEAMFSSLGIYYKDDSAENKEYIQTKIQSPSTFASLPSDDIGPIFQYIGEKTGHIYIASTFEENFFTDAIESRIDDKVPLEESNVAISPTPSLFGYSSPLAIHSYNFFSERGTQEQDISKSWDISSFLRENNE
jgi:hypothetical protein